MRKYLGGRFKSFMYAIKGVKTALIEESNMRIHAFAAVGVTISGFLFHITATEWMFVMIAIGAVWVTELINTAIETIINLVQPDYHPLAGRAKDIAAGAVLIASIMAAIIGIIVFGKYIAGIVLHLM